MNSPRTRSHLLGWDVDAKDPGKAHGLACDVYHDCFVADWDYGGRVYVEHSRNRNGRYIWTIIERASSPAEFNLLVNALSRVLRARHRVDDGNRFDAIKGTLHYDSRDDFAKLWAESDGNPNDDHRGVLVTMPLAGAVARRTFEAEQEAFFSFLAKRNQRYVHAIPEAHLRELVLRYGPEEARRLDDEIAKLSAKGEAAASLPLPPSPVGNTLRVSAPAGVAGEARRQRLTRRAHAETSGKNRMRFASSLYFYTYDRYAPSAEALVAFYKAESFAKGEDTPQKETARLRRAREALDDHRANPAKVGYDKAYWMDLVARWVTVEVRQHRAVKYRSPRTKRATLVEDELLAAGLCVLTLSAFAANRADRMHSCSQVGQEAMYRKLGAAGLLSATFADKRKRVAVPVMLQLAGLIVLRNATWKFGGRDGGVGKCYGIGPHHPRFAEFTGLYGHVVDRTSLPCIVSRPFPVSA